MMKYVRLVSLAALASAFFLVAPSAMDAARAGNRLTTEFTQGKCLDVINDGQNNKLTMATCGKFSGQDWSVTPVGPGGGFKIRNQFSGPNKCLDVVNDGHNDKVIMADCGNFSGQNWSIPKAGGTGGQFKNQFTGSNRCLDIVNDGKNNRLKLADCGNFTGQRWFTDPF
jgi:hypothetical protein